MLSNTLRQPETKDALIVTLNSMGYMLSAPEKYNQSFIDYAASVHGPVLEIGAAYGLSTIPALEKGAYVIANDLDARHLQILKSKVPVSYFNRLEIKPGRMPNEIDFPDNSLEAVLASRVLNFVEPYEFKICLQKIFKWLKPGGKLFILMSCVYMGNYHKFLSTYLKRKKENHPWPGLIEDIQYCAPTRVTDLPKFINLFDMDQLKKSLIEEGFSIQEIGYSPAFEEHPQDMKLDGREQVGAIAIKG